MVAYSFKARFAEPIVEGIKGGTIRGPRKRRHARPGEELQLYTGMRTRQCRLIARRRCIEVEAITLNLGLGQSICVGDKLITGKKALDRFARFDGFPDWATMTEFWPVAEFTGFHIRWLPLSV